MNFSDHLWHMKSALIQAEDAYQKGEVPVGAVLVDADGQVVIETHNLKECAHDPCGHAEIIALRSAAKKLGAWRLSGSKLYVTLEPCPMCMAACIQARIEALYFGAYDPKGGAISLGLNLHQNPHLNHRLRVTGGLEHFECSALLSNFFRERRSYYKKA